MQYNVSYAGGIFKMKSLKKSRPFVNIFFGFSSSFKIILGETSM